MKNQNKKQKNLNLNFCSSAILHSSISLSLFLLDFRLLPGSLLDGVTIGTPRGIRRRLDLPRAFQRGQQRLEVALALDRFLFFFVFRTCVFCFRLRSCEGGPCLFFLVGAGSVRGAGEAAVERWRRSRSRKKKQKTKNEISSIEKLFLLLFLSLPASPPTAAPSSEAAPNAAGGRRRAPSDAVPPERGWKQLRTSGAQKHLMASGDRKLAAAARRKRRRGKQQRRRLSCCCRLDSAAALR